MGYKAFIKTSAVILISLLLIASSVSAQAGRGKGRIQGIVVDKSGKGIPSVKISLEFLQNEKIKWETTTNKDGEWAFLGLGTGMWRVTASAEGYISSFTEIYVRQLERNPKIIITLEKFEESLQVTHKKEESLSILEKAAKLFNEKKYDETISLLEEFLAKNPEAYQALLSIGDCYREKGDFEQAIEKYNTAFENALKDKQMGKEMAAKALAGIGDSYLKMGDFEQAQNYFKKSIETYPENEILAYNVGEIYFSNQKIDEAIYYLELSTQIKPDWERPYLKLGYVFLNKGDYEKAKLNFNKFLTLDPESPEVPTVKNILNYLEKIK